MCHLEEDGVGIVDKIILQFMNGNDYHHWLMWEVCYAMWQTDNNNNNNNNKLYFSMPN